MAAPTSPDATDDWRRCIKQKSDELFNICGENSQLAINVAVTGVNERQSLTGHLVEFSLNHQRLAVANLFFQLPFIWLQVGLAECRCSPFGRLNILNQFGSGSLAERLTGFYDGPQLKATSDSDLMLELGPVQWVTADGTPLTPSTTPWDGRLGSGPQSDVPDLPASRLMIVETENPGFVRVLQERLEDCPHTKGLPFESSRVKHLMDAFYRVISPFRQQNTTGPSVANVVTHSQLVSVAGQVTEHDHVACLYAQGWWPSEEFFERHRKHDWPPKSMRDNIRRFGVHLVPVGAQGSPTESSEWRLSFSRAELLIAMLLTNIQAQSLVAFKTCKSAIGQKGKSVKSYFAKTALFWLCQDLPPEMWTDIVEGAERIINFLFKSIKAGKLPAFLCAEINLLWNMSRAERKTMLTTLNDMRTNLQRLLLMNPMIHFAVRMGLMGKGTGPVPEHELRVCFARSLVRTSILETPRDLRKVPVMKGRRLAALLRTSAATDVMYMIPEERHWYYQQSKLFQAYLVAPEDVQIRMRLSSSPDGGLVWDAAPLVGLLTATDLDHILGDPAAVRAWLRRQHRKPKAERPPGAPADLRSPRDHCDLLLNIPLLNRALLETGHGPRIEVDDLRIETTLPFESSQKRWLDQGKILAFGVYKHFMSLGMDEEHATMAAISFLEEFQQHAHAPTTREEYERLRTILPDPWQLGSFFHPCSDRAQN
ncbi:uncharacterized protein LOC122368454 isoform X1 [Amphibalanus amphitrite]|uniref:uncharacterized protein LOC122368454 isoform X1 n=1 Tax=Amphibalanus amphitrite TaxID=1232801 RepID=UPI001C90A135|nr:uncharacterized protein LOC122368454 isoform X1 [Amphibalanus amphitrite]